MKTEELELATTGRPVVNETTGLTTGTPKFNYRKETALSIFLSLAGIGFLCWMAIALYQDSQIADNPFDNAGDCSFSFLDNNTNRSVELTTSDAIDLCSYLESSWVPQSSQPDLISAEDCLSQLEHACDKRDQLSMVDLAGLAGFLLFCVGTALTCQTFDNAKKQQPGFCTRPKR